MTDPGVLRRLERLEKEVERLATLERLEYASGSWTPEFVGTTTAGTFTYAAGGQIGRWVRNGNKIDVFCNIVLTAIPVAPTGNVVIKTLPFNAQNTAGLFGNITIDFVSNFNYTAGAVSLHARVNANLPYIYLSESFDPGAAIDIPPGTITATTQLVVGGNYLI